MENDELARAILDQPTLLEHDHGVADGRPTHLQFLRQLGLDDDLSRTIALVDDAFSDVLEDLLPERRTLSDSLHVTTSLGSNAAVVRPGARPACCMQHAE